MKPSPDAAPALPRKPRLAFAIATVCGLGYIPFGPGTWGSLVGCIVTLGSVFLCLPVLPILDRLHITQSAVRVASWIGHMESYGMTADFWGCLGLSALALLVLCLLGVWSASRVSAYADTADPQHIIIDEVSGQHLALFFGLAPGVYPRSMTANPDFAGHGFLFVGRLLNWKYLLLGFILFRVFDIWKPFPVRQAEKLPGGWGIMADDWVAAVYAALGLWVARYLGL